MSGLDDTGELVLDAECLAINALLHEIEYLPEWAIDTRRAMPQYGFERCSHRWVQGIDDIMQMIGTEQYWPSTAGHCGDVPGVVCTAAEHRALAVQNWINSSPAENDELCGYVANLLGEQTPEKIAAATCFVELVRAFFFVSRSDETAKTMAATWRDRINENPLLALMFQGEGFDYLLQNRCGFMIIKRLDLYIQLISGKCNHANDRHGVCNDQLRFDYTDDPERIEVTRGYLWGLYAYLMGHNADWLRTHKADCAGAGIYALQRVDVTGDRSLLRRWLVASLLKSAKVWCMVGRKPNDNAPAQLMDLPDVLMAVTH